MRFFMKLRTEIISLMKTHKQGWMYKTLIYLNSVSRLCSLHQRQHTLRWNLKNPFVCAFVNSSTNVTMMNGIKIKDPVLLATVHVHFRA